MTIFFYKGIDWDWSKLKIRILAEMSLLKCYWMVENARVTPFTVFELLRENQQEWGGGVKITSPYLTHPD